MALAVVALANILFLVLDRPAGQSPSLLTSAFSPTWWRRRFLVVGLILIPLGMMVERRRRLRAVGAPPHFRQAGPEQSRRNAARWRSCSAFVVIFTLMSAVGSYKAYEFTDSVQVLRPALPHGHASGVHRLSGIAARARRLRRVPRRLGRELVCEVEALGRAPGVLHRDGDLSRGRFLRRYSNLRPAPQTCEQCHWPKKFWGAQLKVFTHYGSDEQNTPRVIRLLIKTGGGDPALGQAGGGIHWHMNIANKITYFATDEQRQVIPWVRVEDQQGHVTEYIDQGQSAHTRSRSTSANKRRMDCIDCHNRPTHIYVPPDLSVDRSMTGHSIDATLPFIKQQGVQVLTADYKTTDEAQKAIAESINKFYRREVSADRFQQGRQH